MKKGWEVKKLHEVVSFQRGLTYSKKDEVDFSSNIVLRSNNIDSPTNQLNLTELRYISDEIKVSTEKKVRKGSLIICTANGSKSHLGKVALIDDDYGYAFGGFMGQLTPTRDLDSKYLFLVFNSEEYKLHISQLSDGVNINNLKFDDLKDFSFPVPKLSEQQLVVSILDETFTAIDKAKQNAQRNLQNAKELFESYLEDLFSHTARDWQEKKLGEITTKIGSGATPRGGNESYKQEGISLIRSMNVHDRYFREKNLAFIDDAQAKDLNNVTLQEDDVLLNITGASVTRCCVIPKEYLPARVNQHVSIIRPQKEIINPYFLNLLLTSKFYKDQLIATGELGATRQAITKAQLEDFTIRYPKLPKQLEIIKKLDALSAQCKKLEAIYQKKIDDLDELKKVILQKAFSGELKSNDSKVLIPTPKKGNPRPPSVKMAREAKPTVTLPKRKPQKS
ncbi:MAG: Restriction endonuclease subunit [Bacteroidetes bacterium]|nr:Restriction endonuclease subunit [Bacteroidota bacterium]